MKALRVPMLLIAGLSFFVPLNVVFGDCFRGQKIQRQQVVQRKQIATYDNNFAYNQARFIAVEQPVYLDLVAAEKRQKRYAEKFEQVIEASVRAALAAQQPQYQGQYPTPQVQGQIQGYEYKSQFQTQPYPGQQSSTYQSNGQQPQGLEFYINGLKAELERIEITARESGTSPGQPPNGPVSPNPEIPSVPAPSDEMVSFLQEHCSKCHTSGGRIEGSFSLFAVNESGHLTSEVTPAKLGRADLIIYSGRMPHNDEGVPAPLSKPEYDKFRVMYQTWERELRQLYIDAES